MKKLFIILLIYSCTPTPEKKQSAPSDSVLYHFNDTLHQDSLAKNNPYKVVPTQQ